jgi:hypothetical protein
MNMLSRVPRLLSNIPMKWACRVPAMPPMTGRSRRRVGRVTIENLRQRKRREKPRVRVRVFG